MKKLLLLLCLLVPITAEARNKFQGDATDGSTSVLNAVSGSNPKTKVLKSCPGALMYVYIAGTNTLATIYSTDAGAAKDNPFTIPGTGRYIFYADDDTYDLRISGGGCTDHMWSGVSVGGGADTIFLAPTGVAATDTANLTAAVTDALTAPCAELVLGAGTFLINSPGIDIPAGLPCVLRMRGAPNDNLATAAGTIIKADGVWASGEALVDILSHYHTFEDLVFHGNRKAWYSVRHNGASSITYIRSVMVSGLLDGLVSVSGPLNQGSRCDRCALRSNGTIYHTAALAPDMHAGSEVVVTGTASVTAGNATVTFTSFNPTVLLRPAGAFVRVGGHVTLTSLTSVGTTATATTAAAHGFKRDTYVTIAGAGVAAYNGNYRIISTPSTTTFTYTFAGGASPAGGTITALSKQNAWYGQILSATSTTVVVQPLDLPPVTLANQEFAVGEGFGWHDPAGSMNGYNLVENSWLRENGAGGFWTNSLYGSIVRNSLVDFQMIGVVIGINSNLGSTGQVTADHLYMEAQSVDYWLGSGEDIDIRATTRNDSITTWGGSLTMSGTLNKGGRIVNLRHGTPQNFNITVRNNAGITEHRIIADHFATSGTRNADKVAGASSAYNVTPTINAVTPFTAGVGVSAAIPYYLTLDSINDQLLETVGSVVIESSNTGANYNVYLRTVTENINGFTQPRLSLVLTDALTGVGVPWNTLPVGTNVGVRVNVMMK